MARIGITGHRGLPPETNTLIDAALREALSGYPAAELVGVSCIADGADSLFATAITDQGGALEAIVPADEYRDGLPEAHHPRYDQLLATARHIHRLPFRESTSESHMAASQLMLTIIDELFAVWDGQPARGYGGTADVVTEAHKHDLPVRLIWPNGAVRD